MIGGFGSIRVVRDRFSLMGMGEQLTHSSANFDKSNRISLNAVSGMACRCIVDA